MRFCLDAALFTSEHARAVTELLPDDVEQRCMVAFVGQHLQAQADSNPVCAILAWYAATLLELIERRPDASPELIEMAAAGIVMLGSAVVLRSHHPEDACNEDRSVH